MNDAAASQRRKRIEIYCEIRIYDRAMCFLVVSTRLSLFVTLDFSPLTSGLEKFEDHCGTTGLPEMGLQKPHSSVPNCLLQIPI
jgi:hypothetical protein